MPISVAIRTVTAADATKPARARRNPPKRLEEFLMLRIKRLPLQRATKAAGTTSHFKRQAATSPAVTIAERVNGSPLNCAHAKMTEPRKLADINTPLAAAPRARP